MGDNPIYWPGHQNPASWQQTATSANTQQQLNSMTHYSNQAAAATSTTQQQQQAGMQPLQRQHQQSMQQQQQQQPGIYQSMMPTSTVAPQPPPPQSSHYPHQYSSYWNQQLPPQPQGGYHPTQPQLSMSSSDSSRVAASSAAAAAAAAAAASSFHKDIQNDQQHMMSAYAASVDSRRAPQAMSHQQQQQKHPSTLMSSSNATSNLSPTQSQLSMQARAAAAASIPSQASSQQMTDPMRSMPPQQAPPPSWSTPGSYYAQPPNQSPYSSVMNPYMPSYASTGAVPNHATSSSLMPPHAPTTTRPTINQTKPSTNGSERARAAYPPPPTSQTHAIASMYNQAVGPPSGATNGSYYGYDSYYNQALASQATSDSYLSHQSASANQSTQHWPSPVSSNQMISNTSVPQQQPPPPPPTMRPQTGPSNSSIHPQSPSAASSTLPLASRQPPSSQTPDRSPAPQLGTSYPSPGQQGTSTAKSASNSLAQLEQMVMPGSNQTTTRSPTQRSSTDSPSTSIQQMQSSYNPANQSGYFNTNPSAAPPTNQPSYYPQYDSSGAEMQKSSWPEQTSLSSLGPPSSGPMMMDNTQSSYGQQNYDSNSFYTPSDSLDMHSSDKADPYAIDSQTFDDYDDQSSSSKTKKSRAKKGDDKVKKERKPRAPRAPKVASNTTTQPSSPAPTTPSSASTTHIQETLHQPQIISNTQLQPDPQQSQQQAQQSLQPQLQPIQQQPPQQQQQNSTQQSTQLLTTPTKSQVDTVPSSLNPQSPSATSPVVQQTSRQPSTVRTPDRSPVPQSSTSYPSPSQLTNPTVKLASNNLTPLEQGPGSNQALSHSTNNSPIPRTSTDSPSTSIQQMQSSYNPANQSGYFNTNPSAAPPTNQPSYYPQYDSSGAEMQKSSWPEQTSLSSLGPPSSGPMMMDNTQSSYGQQNYDSNSFYSEYTPLSAPTNSSQPTFPTAGDSSEVPSNDKTNEYPSESQPTDDQTEQTSPSKTKKSRAKKSEDKSKRDRKPRAPRASKAGTTSTQPSSPSPSTPIPGPGSQLNESIESVTEEEKPKKERKPRAPKTPKTSAATQSSLPIPISPPAQLQDSTSTSPHLENSETLQSLDPASQLSNSGTDPSNVASQSDSTPAEPKPKRIRIRDSSSKGKKKLPKFALKFSKTKKRKRLGSSDNDQSDLDKTPPPSPDEAESGVLKRRSARNTKKLKYNDDIELGFSDSDSDSQTNSKKKVSTVSTNPSADGESTLMDDTIPGGEPTVYAAPVEDTMVVEKIMASRMGQRELEPEPGEVLPPDGTHIEVEEFYVKYKNLSYLHCDWRTLEELEKGDRRVAQKIKRYKQKKDSSGLFSFMDEELFDLQYCEVDRILAMNEVEEMVPASDDEEEKSENSKPALDDENPISINKKQFEEEVAEERPANGEDPDQSQPIQSETTTAEADSNLTDVNAKEVDEVEKKNEEPNQTEIDDAHKPIAVEVETSANEDPEMNTKINSDDMKMVDDQQNKSDVVCEATTTEQQVVEEKPKKMKKKISRHFLVKWRGLSYEDSTWELEEHLDPEKIKHFLRFKDPPPKSKWKSVKRPKPEEWVRKEVSPVYKNNNRLREYQLEGINWLSFCWHQGRNCILADEMGLGKTIQSIAFVNEIFQYGIYGPFLIIVPLSTVGNWAREFETWTDLNVITYHGSSTSREMLKEYEMFYRNEQGGRITSYYKFQVMITTFEIILSDCLDLREIPWRCCIIDEAHRLKNRNCKLLAGLGLLNMEHRVLLTGTPLQNNVEELFSLLNFLEPVQFSSQEQFLQDFGDLKTEAQVDKLKLILKPMMLRRLKDDVEKSLAPKEETIVEVELTNIQKKYYRAILEKNFSFLSKGSTNNNMPNLMNTMMELRKCCIHPYLINGAEEQILYEARQTKLAGGEMMSSFQAMVNSSGKLVLIDKLLPRLRADGHRVLIFSQMVRCLDILEDYVTHKHYPFERIDGRVRGSDRQQAIDRFSKPGSDRFVFLLCTRAGGLGINLTAADTVIIFDSDWNPQNDLQAQARCHRIGQSKAVKIYRLICRNTYEREMFDKASLKLGLDKAVLQSMNTNKSGAGGVDGQLTKKEIEELLKKGAYGALMDDDNAGDKFCEEDIDQILQRRTQVITIDNSEAKGSTFSKATFSSSNNREDIELDDPNFWEKWAKKANIDSDDLRSNDELIQLAPRRRTQTKRYGADGHLLEMSDLESSEEDEETISMRTRGSRGRQPKLTPASVSKRNKRRMFEFDDDEFLASLNSSYWSRGDCLKVEKGLLTYGWGRWDKIIASNRYKRNLTPEDCEGMCRVILLYCLNNYKGDEKIKSFAWDLITPAEEASNSQSDDGGNISTRGRKSKSLTIPTKRTVAEEIADAAWPKEPKNNPEIVLPDDQYKRHLQRNCNRLLIRVKFLDYLKSDILKGYNERILADCNVNEIDLPSVSVDGDLPASWWNDEADKSLLVGIFKHGHDKFNLMRQDPNLSFLSICGPPNKEDLLAEMNSNDRGMDDYDNENQNQVLNLRDVSKFNRSQGRDSIFLKDAIAGEFLENLVDNVARDISEIQDKEVEANEVVDENKNSILKRIESTDDMNDTCENGISESCQTTKMDVTDDESSLTFDTQESSDPSKSKSDVTFEVDTNGFLPFPTANDLNQRFRRLITAYQRNSKKLEIKMAQKARDELKKERTSKYEAAKNEREERKRTLAQKWSRREEADFFRAISSFGVEYDENFKRHDWNRFRALGKLDKKLDETMEEYYKAFVIMCKKVTSKPLTADEDKCPISVDTITEDRAIKCLARIEFLNKIRGQILVHPELDERLKLCLPQSDLPDWWENGKHDKELLLAASKHGLTRLDYNLAHDSSLFDSMIRQKAEQILSQPPSPILIPIEQLEELLERNGIEYLRDLDLHDDADDARAVLNSILDAIETDERGEDSLKNSFDLLDGTPGKMSYETHEKSLLANKTPPKVTRSATNATNSNPRPSSSIVTRRGANTVVKSAGSGSCVRLTSLGHTTKIDDCRLVEITPILPDKIPDDLTKSFEAGEISLSLQSESALLHLDNLDPIVLVGATNPVCAKIRWPKDKAIQTRLENLVYLVENNEWPSPPRPPVPTITLPVPQTSVVSTTTPLIVATSSPTKNDKDISLGSPKSDISNISSKASKQDAKEQLNELSAIKGRRGRGRRPKKMEHETDPPEQETMNKDDQQAAAKLRNLLSQGPSSASKASNNPSTGISGDKLTAKFGTNKQGNLSSLLASFKKKRTDDSGASRGRDEKNLLDLINPSTANLLPQILANMKPEFRDLLANQETATMLINSLSGLGGVGNVGSSLRSSNLPSQLSLENLMNITPTSTKGPPPAHQRADNPPSAHGNSSTRELRRNSQNARENSPPSINLRSTRGRGSMTSSSSTAENHQKSTAEVAHNKSSTTGKRRGRPASGLSESPPSVPGADVLDLSSLQAMNGGPTATQSDSRSRRHRDHSDMPPSTSTRSSSSGVSSKANSKSGSKPSDQESEQAPVSEKGVRTTRASKRIGSRIDALALNLQAKKMHRGDSPTSDLSPTLPKPSESPMAAHGRSKSPNDHKSQNSKAPPPAAHSGSQKSNASSNADQQREKINPIPATSAPNLINAPTSRPQDVASQFMTNPAALLAGLNPAALGGAGDIMNQLLRKAGTNDIVKNLLNEFMKNPSLALDPNILATLASSLPMGSTPGLPPGFNLPTPTPPATSSKSASNSLLTDFKPPAQNNQMKRSRQDPSSLASSNRSTGSTALPGDGRRAPSDKHDRRSSSSSFSGSDRKSASSSAYNHDKHGKGDKRGSSSQQQELPSDTTSSRRSSSSLLAQQAAPPLTPTTNTSALPPNSATLNLANQFGGLNSLGGLLGFPNMNELMKQMSSFPGFGGSLPRIPPAPVIPTSNSSGTNNSGDKGSRRSRQSTTTTPATNLSNQQAANAALANSIMNLASQPNAASNPYGNYNNPLNPFLPFGLANLGMNNLGMGLFPNIYMPPGFPGPDQQQSQPQSQQQSGSGSSDNSSKDKKLRYPRK